MDSSRSHRTRPPDVEEALSSMLWTPYERGEEVVESPPYQRRNKIFAFPLEGKGQPVVPPLAKLRTIAPSSVPSSSRFSFPFVSSIGGARRDLPSYEDIIGSKRLSTPESLEHHHQPPFVVNGNYSSGGVVAPRLNNSFTDEFISSRVQQVRSCAFLKKERERETRHAYTNQSMPKYDYTMPIDDRTCQFGWFTSVQNP